MKKALITGITGQDGSYLADYLLSLGYRVYGMIRRSSTVAYERIHHLIDDITILNADILDQTSLMDIMAQAQPDEIYNLAAQSFVPTSWNQPVLTGEFTALGVTRILESARRVVPGSRIYQASSSEMFGKVLTVPQNEKTPFYPRSPYGAAKVYGHWITINYRESYNQFACSGILFNHESPRRGHEFVTRKISHSVARIKLGQIQYLELGNIDSRRDWGYAGDYVKAMHLMLQQPEPEDYVISTGETHSVREFCEYAFEHAGIPIEWTGEGLKEQGVDKKTGQVRVKISPKYYRPAEVDLLIGDSSKAQDKLGWKPSVRFKDLIEMMVDHDLKDCADLK